ncbi:D-alanyl-D-alanine carboxypeptidase/D-alanyl-D-alanine-endopeptidase [Rhodohalobacter sp. SW132]|uniref:D-alanyl-D-alanine carboxypeptidase/D-alanyl-D-alanine endopeptidase n=1 Tax=Rhodohalobacter sp. SW132 TaxID=2293433 RepID=UPI0013147AB5|nr:D-alanyl-D-alanine carboxypeptidase/D-alanyl-D-alanine-endopeptidase [Rhodohalobacter sp. SW132]
MKNHHFPFFPSLLCFGFLLFGLITPARGFQTVDPVQDIIRQSHAASSFWSVVVRDSENNVIYDYNGDKLIRPASNLKLVSSAAFLELLGHDHQFNTKLYGTGEQDGQTWRGDLYIRGNGDPSINGEAYDDPFFLFERWYSVLDSMGIETIDGNIIGHDGLFDDVPYPRGWEWDDLSYYYAPEISALSFNMNVVNLEVRADGSPGSRPSITWFPFDTPYVRFVNEQTITPQGTRFDESYRRELGENTIYLRSRLPQGYYETEPLSIHNPSLFFIDTFSRYLDRHGINVRGQLLVSQERVNWDAPGFTPLDSHRSKPLSTMITRLNRESDNFYTEMLLKYLASEKYGVQGTTELGLQLLEEYMESNGFTPGSIMLRDASGMAPATQLKAGELNHFLFQIQYKPYFDIYLNSLSVGSRNGTLRYRFHNSPVSDGFRGKTGFLSGVRSLSGYLETAGGDRLVVTIATNNYTVRTAVVDLIHERILNYLYTNY